jgi:CubicO group peptidase (beta-lactamase class C family)
LSPASLDRRHFILTIGAGAALARFHKTTLWSSQRRPWDGNAAPAAPSWLPSQELVRSVPRLLELADVPGLALGIVEQGRVWKSGFGHATSKPPTPVLAETVFEAVSLGKPLFAYAVLRLADKESLDLDRPLYDYLPLPEADNPRMRRVTAAHVLAHTTGLPNWRDQPGPLLPASEAGTTFSYSGEAYYYLQRVIEGLTQQPFARMMRDQVLIPLGLTGSSYVWLPGYLGHKATGRDENGNEADVYQTLGQEAERLAQQWGKPVVEWRYEDAARAVPLLNPQWPVLPLYMIPSAAGSLLTTVSDYTRFLMRLVAPPETPGLELSRHTRQKMMTPQVRLNRVLSWGLGWGIQRDEYGEVLWHWGANDSFRNFVIADVVGGRAVVVFTNGQAGPKVYERVITAVTGHDQPAFLWI